MLVNGKEVTSLWLGGSRFDTSKIGQVTSYQASGFVTHIAGGQVPLYTAPLGQNGSITGTSISDRQIINIIYKEYDEDGSLWYQINSQYGNNWIQAQQVIIIGELIPYNDTGIVQYVGAGSVTLKDSPTGSFTSTYVSNGSVSDITGKMYDSHGALWYRLEGYSNYWIAAQYMSLFNQTEYFKGCNVTAKVVYSGAGKVGFRTSPWSDRQMSGTYVGNGETIKLTRKSVNDEGQVWYCANYNNSDQWIQDTYLSLS